MRITSIALVGALALFSLHAGAETIRLEHVGLTLNANVEKTDDWPTGPVVLMTHGTLGHSGMEIMSTLQTLFADNGVSSLAINLSLGLSDRSHAMYDCPTPHHHRHTDALDEIGFWLGRLKEEGARNIVLLGHSRGGNQTAWYAAEHDDPAISQVVLVAPMVWDEEQEAAEYRKNFGTELDPLFEQAHAMVADGRGGEFMAGIDFLYCKDTNATADAVVSYYAPDPRRDTPRLLAKIAKPVVVIAGSDDKAVSGLIEKVEPLADGERVKLVVIDGADHFFRDLYADELVEAVVRLIRD